MFTVYILYSEKNDQYYVGYTNNLKRRISEHNRKKGKFTDRGIPWEIVYTETYTTKEEANSRELCLKVAKSNIKGVIVNSSLYFLSYQLSD